MKTLLSENRKTVIKERTEHNSKLRDCITKFISQIIYERQDSAAKINAIEAKYETTITNTHSKRVNLVKRHMAKIQIERGKNKKILEKIKLMSNGRLIEEQGEVFLTFN